MTQRFKFFPILTVLALLTISGAGTAMIGPRTGASAGGEGSDTSRRYPAEQVGTGTTATEAANVVIPQPKTPMPVTVRTSRWQGYPNVCESFTVTEADHPVRNKKGELVYPTRHRRNRYHRRRSDQRRTAQLVRMVVREMGADVPAAYLLDMISAHEASHNSEAIHILNKDREANQEAWAQHTYDVRREQEILARMKVVTQRDNSQGYYDLKGELADLRMYRDNPHWHDEIEYTHVIPEREIKGEVVAEASWQEHESIWHFGYGLYGMNAVLFTHVWDREAPPWVLCGDEGIIATVTAVWALRSQQAICAEVEGEEGTTIGGLLWRWGHGQCGTGRLGPAWRKLMKEYAPRVSKRFGDKYTFDWETVPDFGTKFPRYEMYRRGGKMRFRRDENGRKIPTDRKAIVEHMLRKAEAEGLLRERPLELKNPGTEPVIVPGEPPAVARRD